MANKNIIIFVAILVVLVFAGVMVFITSRPLPEKEEEIDTSDWKTYRNEQHGFEVKCSADCNIKENEEVIIEEGSGLKLLLELWIRGPKAITNSLITQWAWIAVFDVKNYPLADKFFGRRVERGYFYDNETDRWYRPIQTQVNPQVPDKSKAYTWEEVAKDEKGLIKNEAGVELIRYAPSLNPYVCHEDGYVTVNRSEGLLLSFFFESCPIEIDPTSEETKLFQQRPDEFQEIVDQIITTFKFIK